MVRRRLAEVPHWTSAELEQERQKAVAVFVSSGGTAGKTYQDLFEFALPLVTSLFENSNNLLNFSGAVLQQDYGFLIPARYLAGPPISSDDLKTFVGSSTSKKSLSNNEVARKVAEVLRTAWDPVRFPWIKENRPPTQQERSTAIVWTSGLWAVEMTRTLLRNASSKRQEDATADLFESLGLKLRSNLREIANQDDLNRGEFARRISLGGSNADLVLRLQDGRVLALECKVSNSAANSYKRLIHDTGLKAGAWRRSMGDLLISGAVLAGVFTLPNLRDAQNSRGIVLFWEHDLKPLSDFIQAAV